MSEPLEGDRGPAAPRAAPPYRDSAWARFRRQSAWELVFAWDRIRGRPTRIRVRGPGATIALRIASRREIRRAAGVAVEAALLQRVQDHLTSRDVVWDVGANIGLVTLLLARSRVGRECRFHAFEPEPRNFAQLRRNIEANELGGRVRAHRVALGCTEGEVELFVRGGEGEGRHSTVAPGKATGSIRVPVTTASAFARRDGPPPTVVKIDVEGAEGRVLAGMEELLAAERPRDLFMEIHPKGEGDRMPDGAPIHDWLEERGYRLAWEERRRSGLHRHYR